MPNDKQDKPERPGQRSWQDLGNQYHAIGIAAVAAAMEIFSAPEPKPAPRKAAVRYIGNRG